MINQLFFGFTIFKIEQHLFFSYNWLVFGKPENWSGRFLWISQKPAGFSIHALD
jgi:hypothetical protein